MNAEVSPLHKWNTYRDLTFLDILEYIQLYFIEATVGIIVLENCRFHIIYQLIAAWCVARLQNRLFPLSSKVPSWLCARIHENCMYGQINSNTGM